MTGFFDLGSDFDILSRRLGIATGVVVGDDEANRTLSDGFAEDFAETDDGGVGGADVDGGDSQDHALGVEIDGNKVLLPLVPQVVEKIGNVLRICDRFDFEFALSRHPDFTAKGEHGDQPLSSCGVKIE